MEQALKQVCLEIGKRYEFHFVEIGVEEDHVHFLVQSVPIVAPSTIVQHSLKFYGYGILMPCPQTNILSSLESQNVIT